MKHLGKRKLRDRSNGTEFMPLDHSRLRELFLAACDLSEPDQIALLDEQCSDDPEMQRELRLLLQSDARTGGILSDENTTDGIQFQFDTVAESAVPERIGRYQVKRILGQGGMGVVYLATQRNPAREVAVKVIRSGMVSPDLLKRFEVEASVLGRLAHPGIARIYEAGTFTDDLSAQERPFLAMEYVLGQPLRQFIRESDLTARDRLHLFVQICDAVQHAHQRGVIHRDLKPGNILVQADRQPSILDFGVARATESDPDLPTLQTRVGQLIGTLPYMSPEQVSGNALDVDTRSDVYALGVIAYELLSGKLPYDIEDSDYLKAAKAISEHSPIPLTSIKREFRGDVNTIVLKALEKDPARRYQSASELGDDVQRYLDDQPIVAVPIGSLGRFRKWCQRNKAVAALLGLLALAVTLGFGGVTRQTFNALEAKRLAEESASRTERVLETMVRSFRSPDPTIDGRDVKMVDVLNKAVSDLDQDLTEDPLLKAKLLFAIGKSMQGLGIYDQGVRVHKAALDIRTRELGEEHPDTIASLSNLGALHYLAGEYEDSIKVFVRSLELHTKVLGEEHPDTLKAIHNVAIGHSIRGNMDEAIQLTKQALAIQQHLLGPTHLSCFRSMNSLGLNYMLAGDHDQAFPVIESVKQLTEEHLGERHPATIESLGLYAWVYGVVRPVSETIPIHVEVMARFQDVLGEDHLKTLNAEMNAAVAYLEDDNETETIRLLELALPKFQEKLGDEHESSIISVTYLADAYLVTGRTQDALELLSSSPTATSEERLEGRRFLAEALLRTGQKDEGVAILEDLLITHRAELAANPAGLADALAQIALRYLRANMFSEAEPYLRESRELLKSEEATNELLQFTIESALGASLTHQGEAEEAEPLLLSAARGLSVEKTKPPFPTTAETAIATRRLVNFYEQTDRLEEAGKWRRNGGLRE